MRLIQRLCLLYGFETTGANNGGDVDGGGRRVRIDYGKDLAEKQMLEKLAPRIAGRLAVKIGEEAAEKWVGRMIPLASSAIGGALNFSFVRAGAAACSATSARSILKRSVPPPPPAYTVGRPRDCS